MNKVTITVTRSYTLNVFNFSDSETVAAFFRVALPPHLFLLRLSC